MTNPNGPLIAVRHKIDRAARAAGRNPDDVSLTAVSKQQAWGVILPVLEAGHRIFGENRVQEAVERWDGKRPDWPGLELRLIGPLQSNKAADAVTVFDAIETLDRESLAGALAVEIEKQARAPELFVQINTGEEPQKSGVSPGEADAFIDRCRTVHGLTVTGLMCIPPADQEPSMHFALLGKIAARNGLTRLSMGMSGDYEAAVRHGATHVRVGSALFGARD